MTSEKSPVVWAAAEAVSLAATAASALASCSGLRSLLRTTPPGPAPDAAHLQASWAQRLDGGGVDGLLDGGLDAALRLGLGLALGVGGGAGGGDGGGEPAHHPVPQLPNRRPLRALWGPRSGLAPRGPREGGECTVVEAHVELAALAHPIEVVDEILEHVLQQLFDAGT